MNRSKVLTLAAHAVLSAHAAPPTMKTGVCYIDDGSGDSGGGEGKKSDDVTLAKGAVVGEEPGNANAQQQQAASDTGQIGSVDAKSNLEQNKAAIGDSAGRSDLQQA